MMEITEKLSPRYIGPYEVIERVGPLAYKLALPPELSRFTMYFMFLCLGGIDRILRMY